MTAGSKFLLVLLLGAGLAGAGAGGGIYYYRKHTVAPLRNDLMVCQKSHALLMTRSMLAEASMGLLQQNGGYAFERTMRAEAAAQRAGLKMSSEFEEARSLLLSGDDKAAARYLARLADKVLELPAALKPPGAEAPAPGPAAVPPAGAAPPSPAPDKGTPPGPGPAAAPAGAAPAAKGEAAATAPAAAKVDPPAGTPAAKIDPAKADPAPPQAAPRPADPPKAAASLAAPSAQEGYSLLLDAKTALVQGDTAAALAKVARARVVFDEVGRDDLDADLDAAITALRVSKDESRARSSLDSALKKLR